MNPRAAILLGLALISPELAAADAPSLWSRITLQQTLDKKAVPEPAALAFLFPAGGEKSYSIQAGLRLDLAPTAIEDYLELGPFLEYSRNTDLKNEQNSLRAGVSADWTTTDLANHPWTGIVTGKVNYARQPKKDSDSFQASAMLTFLPRGMVDHAGPYWIPNTRLLMGPVYFTMGPYFGVEYERVFKAKETTAEGSVVRLAGRLQVALQGRPESGLDRFEALTEFEYRRDIHDSTSNVERDHGLFRTGLTYYFLKPASDDDKKNVGLSIQYSNGSDPAKGLERQEFTQLSLRVRL